MTGAGFLPSQIDDMTLSQVEEIFDYWRKHPPANEIVAWAFEWKPRLTVEEQWAQGAMGPEDFARWCEMTGGRARGPISMKGSG